MNYSSKIDLYFYKSKGNLVDKIIRWWTKSLYSHVEVEIKGKSYSSSPRDGGVRSKTINFKREEWDKISIKCSKRELENIICRFEVQKGKKYDFLGIILSQIINFNIENPNKWFCSELSSYMISKIIDFPKPFQYYSPEKLYNFLKKNKRIINEK